MAQRGAQVTGIDMGEAPLAVARLHQLESGVEVTYRQITAEALAEEMPGQFDVVTCLEMLEHVPDPASIIRACYTLVKPGGQVFSPPLIATLRPICLPLSVQNTLCVCCRAAPMISKSLFALLN